MTEFRRWVAARVARIIAAEAGLAQGGPCRGDRGHGRGRGRLVAGRAPALEPRELADELAGLAWKGFARFLRSLANRTFPSIHPASPDFIVHPA